MSMWAFYDRATDEQPHVTYSAVKYDQDGKVVSYGAGKTPQDALYAMRLVIDGWEDSHDSIRALGVAR